MPVNGASIVAAMSVSLSISLSVPAFVVATPFTIEMAARGVKEKILQTQKYLRSLRNAGLKGSGTSAGAFSADGADSLPQRLHLPAQRFQFPPQVLVFWRGAGLVRDRGRRR